MTVILELKPETEAGLAAQAAARGLPLPEYVRRVLEDQLPARRAPASLSPAERAAAWLAPIPGQPIRPPLSDEAISRESLYDVRG